MIEMQTPAPAGVFASGWAGSAPRIGHNDESQLEVWSQFGKDSPTELTRLTDLQVVMYVCDVMPWAEIQSEMERVNKKCDVPFRIEALGNRICYHLIPDQAHDPLHGLIQVGFGGLFELSRSYTGNFFGQWLVSYREEPHQDHSAQPDLPGPR